MTTSDILALQPGPELDKLIHLHVFGGAGKALKWSTDPKATQSIIDRLPLFVGRVDPRHEQFKAARPFVAGELRWDADRQADITKVRVTAASPSLALVKAALIYALSPEEEATPKQTPEERAREIASRVGTPSARTQNVMTAQPSTSKRNPPALRTMPKRPKEFVGPQPIQVAGKDSDLSKLTGS